MKLKEIAMKVLDSERKIITDEFRSCELVGVETRYGNTNNTPILALLYKFEDTGEVVEDIFCFTEKSLEIVIKRLNSAYLGFTGETLIVDDFSSTKTLINKFNSIIGKESQVKVYTNKNNFYCYQHNIQQREEAVNTEEQNIFWSELKAETEVKENNNNEINSIEQPVPSSLGENASLQEILEVE